MKKIIALGLLITTVAAVAADDDCGCWINAKTGKQVPSNDLLPHGAYFNDPRDPNHATSPSGPTVPGADFVRLPNNSWVNAKTGKQVPCNDLLPHGAYFNDPRDPNHATSPSGPTVP